MSVKAAFQPTAFLGAYGHDANRWMIEGSSTATAHLVSPGRYRIDGSDSIVTQSPHGQLDSTLRLTPRSPPEPARPQGAPGTARFGLRSTPLVVLPSLPDRFSGTRRSLHRPSTERLHRPITTQNGREFSRAPAPQHGWLTSRPLTAVQLGQSSWLNKYSPTRTRQEQAFTPYNQPPDRPKGDWVKVAPFQKWSWVKSQGEMVGELRPGQPLTSSSEPQMDRDEHQVHPVPTPPRSARRRVYCTGAR